MSSELKSLIKSTFFLEMKLFLGFGLCIILLLTWCTDSISCFDADEHLLQVRMTRAVPKGDTPKNVRD